MVTKVRSRAWLRVTHVQADEGESRREATLLLGIDGLRVVDVTQDDDGIRHVQVVTDDPGAVACPACGVVSTSIKGHVVTAPRDIPYGARPIHLSWRKRRWRCRERLCARASFTESVPAVPARSRVTTRLRAQCGAGIAQRFTCVLAGAAYYGLSWPVAHQGYVAHVSAVLAQPLPLVAVLGIDETRRGKVQWHPGPGDRPVERSSRSLAHRDRGRGRHLHLHGVCWRTSKDVPQPRSATG